MGRRTPIGKIIDSTWLSINMRAANGKYRNNCDKNKVYNNINIQFTREDLKNYCTINQDSILALNRPSIDRIDSNKDYALDNIRFIELEDNIRRKRKGNKYIGSTIKRGVGQKKDKFIARLSINGRLTHLGSFNTSEEAYETYRQKYNEINGSYPW